VAFLIIDRSRAADDMKPPLDSSHILVFVFLSLLQIMKLMNSILGEKLFNMLMKSTFYGHFVAGEDQIKIVPTLER
jgi:hypothetical protein